MQRALKHVPKSSWCAASSDFCNGYWPWKSASITWSCETHVRFLIFVQRVAIAIPPQRSDLRVLELSPKRPTPATLPTIYQFTRHLWDIVRHCETCSIFFNKVDTVSSSLSVLLISHAFSQINLYPKREVIAGTQYQLPHVTALPIMPDIDAFDVTL